jgi:adenylate cyclase
MVGSTQQLVKLGEESWKELLDRHDDLLSGAIQEQGGIVIKHTGDGFFAAFAAPEAAVEAAVGIQRATEGEEFTVRIGVHSGEALKRGSDYTGRGVNVAARIGALASAGEILVSTDTVDGADVPYTICEQRTAELKGFDEAVPIAAVSWR